MGVSANPLTYLLSNEYIAISAANMCPGSKLYDGCLQRLHSANDVPVIWLEGTAVKALVR